MTIQDFNHIYEESVYQVRLRVAVALLCVPGVNQDRAIEEADKFVERLLDEDANWLTHRYNK